MLDPTWAELISSTSGPGLPCQLLLCVVAPREYMTMLSAVHMNLLVQQVVVVAEKLSSARRQWRKPYVRLQSTSSSTTTVLSTSTSSVSNASSATSTSGPSGTASHSKQAELKRRLLVTLLTVIFYYYPSLLTTALSLLECYHIDPVSLEEGQFYPQNAKVDLTPCITFLRNLVLRAHDAWTTQPVCYTIKQLLSSPHQSMHACNRAGVFPAVSDSTMKACEQQHIASKPAGVTCLLQTAEPATVLCAAGKLEVGLLGA